MLISLEMRHVHPFIHRYYKMCDISSSGRTSAVLRYAGNTTDQDHGRRGADGPGAGSTNKRRADIRGKTQKIEGLERMLRGS